MSLTAERLREVLAYSRETGVFTRQLATSNRSKAGTVVGTVSQGRLIASIDNRVYLLHRLAWLHVYGKWPEHNIDHINGNSLDNRIANLRDVPQRMNVENQRGPRSNNTSGFLGVMWHKKTKAWRAKIGVNGRYITVGYFHDPEDAAAAYLAAKRSLHQGNTL